jgi:hypothetical protein
LPPNVPSSRQCCTFAEEEQANQLEYFGKHLARKAGHLGRPFQLRPEHRLDALLEPIRETARSLFEQLGIQWHSYIGHGRSSQACCINFLMPLASRPELLSQWVSHLLGIEPPRMLPIEEEIAGDHRYVAFEYTGPGQRDYLGEAEGGVPQRGAHATASDAAVAFVDARGHRTLLMIEWKYSEQYRNHRLSQDKAGKRVRRYAEKAFAPNGPVRGDLGLALTDFFHEPFYQLLRQQMLAWQIEHHPNGGFDTVQVLHLSPSRNKALHHVTAPRLREIGGVAYSDAFVAYRACLVEPDRFIERSIEQAFAPLAGWPEAEWFPALSERYPSLTVR